MAEKALKDTKKIVLKCLKTGIKYLVFPTTAAFLAAVLIGTILVRPIDVEIDPGTNKITFQNEFEGVSLIEYLSDEEGNPEFALQVNSGEEFLVATDKGKIILFSQEANVFRKWWKNAWNIILGRPKLQETLLVNLNEDYSFLGKKYPYTRFHFREMRVFDHNGSTYMYFYANLYEWSTSRIGIMKKSADGEKWNWVYDILLSSICPANKPANKDDDEKWKWVYDIWNNGTIGENEFIPIPSEKDTSLYLVFSAIHNRLTNILNPDRMYESKLHVSDRKAMPTELYTHCVFALKVDAADTLIRRQTFPSEFESLDYLEPLWQWAIPPVGAVESIFFDPNRDALCLKSIGGGYIHYYVDASSGDWTGYEASDSWKTHWKKNLNDSLPPSPMRIQQVGKDADSCKLEVLTTDTTTDGVDTTVVISLKNPKDIPQWLRDIYSGKGKFEIPNF